MTAPRTHHPAAARPSRGPAASRNPASRRAIHGSAIWVSPTRIYHGGLGRFLQKDPLYWMGAFEQDDPFVLSGKYFSLDTSPPGRLTRSGC